MIDDHDDRFRRIDAHPLAPTFRRLNEQSGGDRSVSFAQEIGKRTFIAGVCRDALQVQNRIFHPADLRVYAREIGQGVRQPRGTALQCLAEL